ncbi:MAG TPA: AMP-binding protein, partial [Microthrixaceae bacterium]|nr:AMP-binding protein [Microthrixaceae bacterium]
VVHVSRNPLLFSAQVGSVVLEDSTPESLATAPNMLLSMDPPRHTRMRALVARGFTPRRVVDLEPRIREIAIEYLDAARDAESFDIIRDFAGRLPMDVISEMMGVPRADRDELRRLADLLVHREEGIEDVPPAGIEAAVHPFRDYAAMIAARAPGDYADTDAEEPAFLVYTSGTTSRPQGAVISHRASVIQGIAISMLFGMHGRDRTCVVLPLFHVNAQYVGVVPTLTVGGTIVLLELFSARKFWEQVRRHRCTLMSIVPMLLRTMLAQPPHEDDRRHDVRVSFYALPTTDEEWDTFEARFGVTLIEGYGLSETLGICTSNPATHGVTKRHCIGLPVLGREVRVVGEDRRDLPPGEVGRILRVRHAGERLRPVRDEHRPAA